MLLRRFKMELGISYPDFSLYFLSRRNLVCLVAFFSLCFFFSLSCLLYKKEHKGFLLLLLIQHRLIIELFTGVCHNISFHVFVLYSFLLQFIVPLFRVQVFLITLEKIIYFHQASLNFFFHFFVIHSSQYNTLFP